MQCRFFWGFGSTHAVIPYDMINLSCHGWESQQFRYSRWQYIYIYAYIQYWVYSQKQVGITSNPTTKNDVCISVYHSRFWDMWHFKLSQNSAIWLMTSIFCDGSHGPLQEERSLTGLLENFLRTEQVSTRRTA